MFTSALVLLVTVFLLTYSYLKYVYSYWARQGVPYIAPTIPLGNLGLVATRKTSFGVNLHELYKQTTLPFIGIYLLFRPAILVRDADLVKSMLTTDFQNFHDRGVYCNPEHDPLSENMFAMPGHRWRTLRNKLTPTFTSGKLKNMFPTILEEGNKLFNYLIPLAKNAEIVEMKDLCSR